MGKRGPKTKEKTQFGNLSFDLEFYKSKLVEDPTTGCMNWTGAKHKQGYGMMSGQRLSDDKKIMTVTHRIAKMIELGRELTHDEFVIRKLTCNNNACCNPDHLYVGDSQDRSINMHENMINDRASPTGKEYKRHYKYTEDEVRWIRTANTLEIAERYGVSRGRASVIRSCLHKTYKWVK